MRARGRKNISYFIIINYLIGFAYHFSLANNENRPLKSDVSAGGFSGRWLFSFMI